MIQTTASRPAVVAAAGGGSEVRRVLLVAPQPFYEDRGTPIAVHHVLRALSALGYAVDVLTYPIGRPVAVDNVDLIRVHNPFRIRHVPIGLSARKLLLDGLLVGSLARRLGRQRYACIHAVEEAAFPAVLLGRRHGVPVIYDMQSSLPEQLAQRPVFRLPPVFGLLRRCERWLLANADAVVSSAGLAHQAQGFARNGRISEWRFPSARQPVEAAGVARLRAELGIPDGAPVVVYAGTFEPYQGLDNLLGAVGPIVAAVPDAVVVLVGGSEAGTAEVLERLAAQGVACHVRVVPRQPRERMPAFLALADVLVSARNYGGNLPLKVFDYLAAGRPIVATDVPTHRTVLDHDRAVLVPPTPAGLAAGVLRVLLGPDEAARLARAAADYAERHLGWDRFVGALQEVYDGVCRRG